MPGAVQNSLHVLTRLFVTTALEHRDYYIPCHYIHY